MPPLVSLLFACSLHLDDSLLLAVVDAFSQGNPYAVQNVALDVPGDSLGIDVAPRSRVEAEATVARIAAAGGEPVVGLLPLRPTWLGDLQKTPEVLFDPCQAVEVATAKISEFDYACRRLGPSSHDRRRRACTLDRYGAAVGLPALSRFVLTALEHSSDSPDMPAESSDDLPEGPEASSLLRPGGIFTPDVPR